MALQRETYQLNHTDFFGGSASFGWKLRLAAAARPSTPGRLAGTEDQRNHRYQRQVPSLRALSFRAHPRGLGAKLLICINALAPYTREGLILIA